MKRFLAVVGLVAFIAACSDSNVTSPVSHLRPGVASRDVGNPPPPPLSGAGSGFLDFEGDAVPAAVSNTPSLPCQSPTDFFLSYTFSYLLNKQTTNEVARLHMVGGLNEATGDVDIHQNTNGGSNANGSISLNGFTFKFQSGDGTIDPVRDEGGLVTGLTFDFSLTGILTDPNGCQVQVSAHLTTNSD